MHATNMIRLLPAIVLLFSSVGCENQQAMVDTLKGEKSKIEKQLTEASETASKLLAENETLKNGIEAAKAAAAQVEEAASQAKTAAEEALASAKKTASDAIAKALADAESKLTSAGAEAKKALDAANGKLAEAQQQLAAANAKVAELEAALKKAQEPAEEEN